MNAFGQKLVDDFDVPELAPVRQAFLDGAHFIYGHTVLQRALGLGYQSRWAQMQLPSRRERNKFYTAVGYCVQPGKASVDQLKQYSSLHQCQQAQKAETRTRTNLTFSRMPRVDKNNYLNLHTQER